MSNVQTEMPEDHPMRVAFEAYRSTESYANTFRWAEYPQHRTGSLWAAFNAGYEAAKREMT